MRNDFLIANVRDDEQDDGGNNAHIYWHFCIGTHVLLAARTIGRVFFNRHVLFEGCAKQFSCPLTNPTETHQPQRTLALNRFAA